MTVISVCTTSVQGEPNAKDAFYNELQGLVNRIPRCDILPMAADECSYHILGRFGLGERCGRGNRLISSVDLNRMIVTNTRSQHPKEYLLPWNSNAGKIAHQIDSSS